MNYCNVYNNKTAYELIGDGDCTIVIDCALGACSAEWWHIAEKLSSNFRVLVFDRKGYGKSENAQQERTPYNIAVELKNLLDSLNITKNIILLGHSQGGYYSMQYAIMYPTQIKGLVLLDPATPFDKEFKDILTQKEYKQSGVDKTAGMKLGYLITSLKLGFLAKSLLMKMPPFYYYEFDKMAEQYILSSLCKKSTYKTVLDEYKFTHMESTTYDVENAVKSCLLGDIPIRLITHSSEFYIKELQNFGNMEFESAKKIENIWQEIMKKTLNLSNNSKHIIAENSGHYIHLTDLQAVIEALNTI